MLNETHIAYLADRGIPADIANRLYKSDGDDLLVPYNDPAGVPYQDSKGKPFVVTRPFPTSRPKFKAPHSCGSRPYFSPLMAKGHIDNHDVPLVFIEGPIKVDTAWAKIPAGFCFIGLTGTWNFLDARDQDGNWDADNDTRALPELKALNYVGRKCIILYDSDIIFKPSVDKAADRFEQWLRTQGGIPYRCELPNEPDGSKNGADDYLVRHGEVDLFNLLENESMHSGWPLPASLLDEHGELRKSYNPRQTRQLVKALAELDDQKVRIHAINSLAPKVKMKPDSFARAVIDLRYGVKRCNPIEPGEEVVVPETQWLWEGVIKKHVTNMIVASPKVGKSAILIQMIADIHNGYENCLDLPISKTECPVILFGIDQSLIDWKHYFDVCGLDKTGKTMPDPLVSFSNEDRPAYLDEEGMELIQRKCQEHPGALVIIDSYFKACVPLGIDENTSLASMPLLELQARLAHLPERPTIVVIHHANRGGHSTASAASRGHSSLAGVPSNNILMRWLNPAEDPSKQTDKRVVIDTEGRSKSIRLIAEMTDNGWIRHEEDHAEAQQEQMEEAEKKLSPTYRAALEFIRKRYYESNGVANVSTNELRSIRGIDYDQKCLACCKALEKFGLIRLDGTMPTITGRGRTFLWVPAEAPETPREERNPCSSSSSYLSDAHEAHDTHVKHEEHVPARVRERQRVEILLPNSNDWENGWVLSDASNPTHCRVEKFGHKAFVKFIPLDQIRPCQTNDSSTAKSSTDSAPESGGAPILRIDSSIPPEREMVDALGKQDREPKPLYDF